MNSMEYDLNGGKSQWKTTSMQDNLNGRRLQWKMTSMEDDCNGRQPQMAYLANFVLSLAQLSPSLSVTFVPKRYFPGWGWVCEIEIKA